MGIFAYGRGVPTIITTLFIMALLASPAAVAAQGGGDPSNGATNYNFHGAGSWWRDIGPGTELTTFNGPFNNAAAHPSQMYMTFWKEPDSGNNTGLAPALDADKLQIKHSLGTTFYYPSGQPTPPDPSKRGYTADDFRLADGLVKSFPNVRSAFPKGVEVVGCHRENAEFFLLRARGVTGAFLVDWVPDSGPVNVAVLPNSTLKGSFTSVLDNLNYYESGGMVEFMELGSYFYYLSRLPTSRHLDVSTDGTAASACPPTPVATATGMQIPEGWTKALKNLKAARSQ